MKLAIFGASGATATCRAYTAEKKAAERGAFMTVDGCPVLVSIPK